MTRLILAATAAFAGVFFGLQPAKAQAAPWCAVLTVGEDSVYWDCRYRSVEECRPNVLAGNRGFCNPNPYAAAYQPGERRRKRKH
jgi:hypothetical protein